ncbi:MAG: substrate-binding domain-containing protein, partial [Pseudomonadota bacterium]
MMRRVFLLVAGLTLAAIALVLARGVGVPEAELRILAAPEHRVLEPVLTDWGASTGVTITIDYALPHRIADEIGRGEDGRYDAVWPDHALWIELGDRERIVRHRTSTHRSPIVLALRRGVAEELGWLGQRDIPLEEIVAAIESGGVRAAMSSATQTGPGAAAFFGLLHALAGSPAIIAPGDLEDAELRARLGSLLARLGPSAGDAAWLMEVAAGDQERIDAVWTTEALMIAANRRLSEAGAETFYAIYPAEGLALADSPLGYLHRGDEARREAFLALRDHLLARSAQIRMLAAGRRAGPPGRPPGQPDPGVWNRAWGVDVSRSFEPVPTPAAEVIADALALYQAELRKPSLTVWVLDVSGSMEGAPLEELKDAMALRLDPEAGAVDLLQPTARDVTIVIPFNHQTGEPWRVDGAEPGALAGLRERIEGLEAGGGTDIYAAVGRAMLL